MTRLNRVAPAVSCLVLALAGCGGGDGGEVDDPSRVQTAQGAVVGTEEKGVVAFKGIPYAQPPVGPLRFAPPRPLEARAGDLQAQTYGAACLQPRNDSSAENCLYLNVWKPASAQAGGRLPVMVYIHGGAFLFGSGADGDGQALVREGNVVFVSFNYRLGALGYVANAALRDRNGDGSLGNFGVMDQQAAMRWVQQNIAAFGGDPANVTMWGFSAGATSAFTLLQSPASRGLFSKAILQSGGGAENSNFTESAALAIGDAFVGRLGCSTAADAVDCLRTRPASEVLAAQGNARYRPIVDGRIVTEVPARAFVSGVFNRVPVMVGGVRDEGTAFTTPTISAQSYLTMLQAQAPGADVGRIAAAYPLSRYAVPSQGVAAANGDAVYSCANSARRDALSAWVPVHGWEFTDPLLSFPPNPQGYYLGTAHGAETAYLLDTLPTTDRTPERNDLAKAMRAYWINFATTGDPNAGPAKVATAWPRFAGPNDSATLALTYPAMSASASTFEREHNCALWKEIAPQF